MEEHIVSLERRILALENALKPNSVQNQGTPLSTVTEDPTILGMIDMGFCVLRHLGEGRTSSVYLISRNGEDCAGKFFNSTYRYIRKHELEMLKILEGVKGVPTVVDELLICEAALFMKPVGTPLTAGVAVNIAHRAVISSVVDIFREAHQRNIVHSDVRLSNILLVGQPGEEMIGVMVIDWGFATRVGVETKFAGSVITGSDEVLEQLRERRQGMLQWTGEDFEPSEMESVFSSEDVRSSDSENTYKIFFHPSDDLVSLVRTLMMHAFPDVRNGLRNMYRFDYKGHIDFWADQMQIRPRWCVAQNYAQKCQYDELKVWIDEYARNFMV